MNIEDIKTMIDKEVMDRIRKQQWVPIEDLKAQAGQYMAFYTSLKPNGTELLLETDLHRVLDRLKYTAKIEVLLEIIEAFKFGRKQGGSLEERYEAVK